MAATAIRGMNVTGLPRRSRQYRQGRVCAYPGCSTKLSTYNRRETCFTHSSARIPRLRGKKTA
jgi:hypothetical protein